MTISKMQRQRTITSSGRIFPGQAAQTSQWTSIVHRAWLTVCKGKQEIYSCVKCKKGFHVTCFGACHFPHRLVEEEFKTSFGCFVAHSMLTSKKGSSISHRLNPTFLPVRETKQPNQRSVYLVNIIQRQSLATSTTIISNFLVLTSWTWQIIWIP